MFEKTKNKNEKVAGVGLFFFKKKTQIIFIFGIISQIRKEKFFNKAFFKQQYDVTSKNVILGAITLVVFFEAE